MTGDLLEHVRAAFPDRAVVSLERAPYRYATSFALEEVQLRFDDGSEQALILKDYAWHRLGDDARRGKPAFLFEPRREIETYLRVLDPEGIGARCVAAAPDGTGSDPWILIEKVPGVELWQVGDVAVWSRTAEWLAGFHARFETRVAELRCTNPYLLHHGPEWFRLWCERARSALGGSDDPRARALRAALARYDGEVVAALGELPATFVHGELYPSNVMVVGGVEDLRVCPIDWEMAATGPALLDLAALVSGWEDSTGEQLAAAYGCTTGPDLDRCRLHLALQWLGWSPRWQAPPEHAHDWVGEATELADRLEL